MKTKCNALKIRSDRDNRGRYAKSVTGARWCFAILVALAILLIYAYGERKEFKYVSPIPEVKAVDSQVVTASERRATTASVIDRYLSKKSSPLAGQGETFYDQAKEHGLDPYLLVAIAGKESSFGKRACGHNPFGWNRCKTTFESWEKAIETLAAKLATLPAYREWREDTKNIAQLALTYNPDTPREWTTGIKRFIGELKEAEFQL